MTLADPTTAGSRDLAAPGLPPAPRGAWWQVARLTFREAVSRRLVIAALLLSAAYLVLFGTGLILAVSSDRGFLLSAGTASILVTLGLYALHFLAAFVALAMAVGAVSAEVDNGSLHALLARPLSRRAFLLGRWAALASMVAGYVALMAGSILILGRLVVGYAPLSASRTLALLVLEAVLLLTLALLASTRLSSVAGGVVVFCGFAMTWVAGFIELIGELLVNSAMVNLGIAVSLLLPADALWRGASYYSQSPILLAQITTSGGPANGIPMFGSSPPAPALLAWSFAYIGVTLALALVLFRRRDL